jgi:gp32 DNA binding protein like
MSNSKEKLAALKAAFDKKTSGGGDQTWKLFYPFWKMPDDATAVVRFLPDLDADNNLGFLVEKLEHELVVNGTKKRVACNQMWGEACPICELSRKYYDEKNEAMGKKYYRKKSYVGQIIVIESPIEHDQSQLVKLVEFGPQVFKQIQAAFQSGDLEDAPYEFKGGYNFRFRKTKTGQGQNSYTTSNFAPKQTDLDDEIIESLNLYNLADYRGKKLDLAVVEALLVADQTGQAFHEAGAPSDGEEAAPPAETVAAKPAHTLPAKVAVEKPAEAPAATTAAPSKANSVLEQLRARAKAAAQTSAA